MVPLLLPTIITCSSVIDIVNRLTSVVGLSLHQKMEIVSELKQIIPTCPITIEKDEPIKKQSDRFDG